jgi:hypothetical protein
MINGYFIRTMTHCLPATERMHEGNTCHYRRATFHSRERSRLS